MVDAYIGNVHFRLNYYYVYEEYDDDHFKDEYVYQYPWLSNIASAII